MRHVTLTMLLLLAGCAPTRTVSLTFGQDGEGLDGFMCKDESGKYLLERLPANGAASLVFDFIALKGVPGCRTGQLLQWCKGAKDGKCQPLPSSRGCVSMTLDQPEAMRDALREQLRARMREIRGTEAIPDAPDEYVLVRVVGTTETCDEIRSRETTVPFVQSKLLGCAYSCPVRLDDVEQSVYLGFDGFVGKCSQGVVICSATDLSWRTEDVQP